MDNSHERQRAVHLMILMCYTVMTLVLSGETILLGWDKGAIVLLLLGVVQSWFFHFTRKIPGEQRLWLYVVLSMLAFFFYGVHETSLFDLAPVMIMVIIMFSATEKFSIIRFCLGIYYLTMCYTLIAVIGRSMEYTPLVVTRLLLHFLLVGIASYLVKINMQRRENARRDMESRINDLEEINHRTENFLTNVSHELRTPINAVTGITAVMLKNESDKQKQKDILAVQQAGQRLYSQIEDILDFTEIDTGRICVVNDNYMISSIVNDLVMGGVFWEKEHAPELIIDVDPKLPAMLEGDGRKIKKILKHLIGNAIKFTKNGGIYVHIFGMKKDYGINLCIRVSDTGEGISEENLSRIMERFYQSSAGENRKAGGLGLGLSIVQGMVSAMGGFLQIRSEIGKGTTVEVSIPQKIADETPGMVVNHKEKLCTACYLKQEKYKFAEVRNYYNDTISHIVSGLELTVHRVFALDELKKLVSIYHLTHLLIGREEYEEAREYFETLASNIQIIVVADNSFVPEAGSRIFLMRKPFHSLPLINILNSSDNTQPKMWDDLHMICPGVRVLVVDDEPMNLMVARGILSDYRMEVETAESGMEAIEICGKENFDLLFLDHMMPSMDGVETLHHIRKLMDETNRNITAIAFTANAVSGAREMFYREGFDEFISKPIETLELERVLRKALPQSKVAYVSEIKLNRSETDAHKEGTQEVVEVEVKLKPCDVPSDWLGELREAGINTDAGLQYSRNDADFYRQIVEKFMGDHEKNRGKLMDFYDRKDWENYRISVHALKSTSKMIGADAFSGEAKAAEDAAKNMDIAYMDAHHEELLNDYRQLADMLKAVLLKGAGTDVQPEEHATTASISSEELCAGLSELSDCLKTFEADRAEDILKKLLESCGEGSELSGKLSEIRSDINDFEMDAAENKVQNLLEQLRSQKQTDAKTDAVFKKGGEA